MGRCLEQEFQCRKMKSDAYWQQQPREEVQNKRKKTDQNEKTEKHIGVHINSNLKLTEQCRKAATKASLEPNPAKLPLLSLSRQEGVWRTTQEVCQASFRVRFASLVTSWATSLYRKMPGKSSEIGCWPEGNIILRNMPRSWC
jgi:hypothetical protein